MGIDVDAILFYGAVFDDIPKEHREMSEDEYDETQPEMEDLKALDGSDCEIHCMYTYDTEDYGLYIKESYVYAYWGVVQELTPDSLKVPDGWAEKLEAVRQKLDVEFKVKPGWLLSSHYSH